MPVYCYVCSECEERTEAYRWSTEGHLKECPKCDAELDRDYKAEGYTVIEDWPPGHNESINYDYKNKADLLSEMRRRGLRPLKHGGGITRARPGLYGKEEHRGIMEKSERVLASLQEA